MRLSFDDSQEHQLAAIDAIVGLFAGQPKQEARTVFYRANKLVETIAAAPNRLLLSDAALLNNLQETQRRNGLRVDDELAKISRDFADDAEFGLLAGKTASFPNFSVEMETGTGKTYVFLRTMRELRRRYGFCKFVIITPSVAVREGALAAAKATEEHFFALHGEGAEMRRYSSARVNETLDFAVAAGLRIMVMTLDSFNKKDNVLRRQSDSLQGDAPLYCLQAARPILVLDEPQNMESELSRESLALLNPAFALRYSATHRNPHNLAYRLSPAEAHRRGLVKTIAVGALEENNPTAAGMELLGTEYEKYAYRARIKLNMAGRDGVVKMATRKFMIYENLGKRTGLPQYDGYVIDDIITEPQKVIFENGKTLSPGDMTADKERVFRAQIRMTIAEHVKAQQRLAPDGIKALSLFFIDRVDNYRAEDGVIRRLFEEEFEAQKKDLDIFADLPASAVHAGYFANSVGGNTEKDVAAFDLIMRDKESLLTFAGENDDEETRRKRQVFFIFTHSALREGWDNPNIFQICALNSALSSMRKRQEIGRGVRLAVDQSGKRSHDAAVNVLTVVANDSYQSYVAEYQREIDEICRAIAERELGKAWEAMTDEERRQWTARHGGSVPASRGETKPQRLNPRHLGKRENKELRPSEEFLALWSGISRKTLYSVSINTRKVIDDSIAELGKLAGAVRQPEMTYVRAMMDLEEGGYVARQTTAARRVDEADIDADIMRRLVAKSAFAVWEALQNDKTRLTRQTIAEIMRGSAAHRQFRSSPLEWRMLAAKVIRQQLAKHLVDGVEYEKIENAFYEWEQHFVAEEREFLEAYLEFIRNGDNCLHNAVYCESAVEREFARDMAGRDDVKLFFKTPKGFKVPTPVGAYNPDWAILLEREGADGETTKKLLFVAETKSAVVNGMPDWNKLRGAEGDKIRCAAKHFGSSQLGVKGALGGGEREDAADYRVVNKAGDIR